MNKIRKGPVLFHSTASLCWDWAANLQLSASALNLNETLLKRDVDDKEHLPREEIDLIWNFWSSIIFFFPHIAYLCNRPFFLQRWSRWTDKGRSCLTKLIRVSLIGVRHDRGDDCGSLWARCPLLLYKRVADFLRVILDIRAFHFGGSCRVGSAQRNPHARFSIKEDLMEPVHMNWQCWKGHIVSVGSSRIRG